MDPVLQSLIQTLYSLLSVTGNIKVQQHFRIMLTVDDWSKSAVSRYMNGKTDTEGHEFEKNCTPVCANFQFWLVFLKRTVTSIFSDTSRMSSMRSSFSPQKSCLVLEAGGDIILFVCVCVLYATSITCTKAVLHTRDEHIGLLCVRQMC